MRVALKFVLLALSIYAARCAAETATMTRLQSDVPDRMCNRPKASDKKLIIVKFTRTAKDLLKMCDEGEKRVQESSGVFSSSFAFAYAIKKLQRNNNLVKIELDYIRKEASQIVSGRALCLEYIRHLRERLSELYNTIACTLHSVFLNEYSLGIEFPAATDEELACVSRYLTEDDAKALNGGLSLLGSYNLAELIRLAMKVFVMLFCFI